MESDGYLDEIQQEKGDLDQSTMIEKSYGEPSRSEYKFVALGCVIEKVSVLGKFINKKKVNGKIIKNGKNRKSSASL